MTNTNMSIGTTYHLYSFSHSACAQRIRIALSLKSVPNVILHNVDMRAGEHKKSPYLEINPSGKVPTLIIQPKEGPQVILTQSTAILEYLEEAFPTHCPLLPPPSQLIERARVREMIGVVTQDIFPRVNRSTATRVFEIRLSIDDQDKWVKTALTEGLDTYEGLLECYGGKYSVGDEITLADICLAPQVYQAYLWGVHVRGDPERWPLIKDLVQRLDDIEAFRKETIDLSAIH